MQKLNSPQKLLLLFDIPKTLLLAEQCKKKKFFDNRQILDDIKPDDNYESHSIFWRKGRQDFLDFFFVKNHEFFDVAIWSSLDREKTGAFTKSFFGRHYRNLLFVSATNRETYEGYHPEQGTQPLKILRDLSQISLKFPQYEMSNMIMISTFANISELYSFNDIVIPQYCPIFLGSEFVNDLTLNGLIKYINGLSIIYNKQKISDVRPALKGKNFQYLSKRIAFHDQQYQEYL